MFWISAAVVSMLLVIGMARFLRPTATQVAASGPQIPFAGPEARQWLQENKNESGFAGNRFDETKNALAFVERLYDLGAVKIIVPAGSIYDEADRVAREGGPYADALAVELPLDPGARRALFTVINEEHEHEGFDPVSDVGQRYVELWWD